MSNVSASFSFPASVASAIDAHAKLQNPPTTLQAQIMAFGIDGALSQALQAELRAQVTEGTVGDDLKARVSKDFNALWNAAWGNYNEAKASPDVNATFVMSSLLAGLQARASKVVVADKPAIQAPGVVA